MRDNKRREPKAGRCGRRGVRRWAPEMIAELTSKDIGRLSPADAAAFITMGTGTPPSCCKQIGKAEKLVDLHCREGADLLLQIDALPRGHPRRRAAVAKFRAMRPYVLRAMDELRYLHIKDALRSRGAPLADVERG